MNKLGLSLASLTFSLLIFSLLLCVASININTAYAITGTRGDIFTPSLRIQNASVQVVGNKISFRPGDKIRVSLTVQSTSRINFLGLALSAGIGGLYSEGGVPGLMFNETIPLRFTLPASQTKTLTFDYEVPRYQPGGPARREVKILSLTGTPIATRSIPVIIEDSSEAVRISNVAFTVGGKPFAWQVGPMVPSHAKVEAKVTLVNPGDTELTLTPKVITFPFTSLNKALTSKDLAPLKLAPKASVPVTVSLPVPESAGVFLSELKFLDDQGNPTTPIVSFRYINQGPIVTALTAGVDRLSVEKGGSVGVFLFLAGAPMDIETGKSVNLGQIQAKLTLYNEKNEVVGQSESPVTFNNNSPQRVSMRISADKDAASLRLNLMLKQGDRILSLTEFKDK